ncbi:hypothetical protein cce_2173 [Crocosphaera subtropica ATCC 51142]|uniref:CHAT domain-containing protein n=2 Tax=Crocosphaera TaxID=263510 RepID=B1WNU4_CROS5|nr:hypothetical protein cce_2173 [Crocosphaera subtropica ATCC 51142]
MSRYLVTMKKLILLITLVTPIVLTTGSFLYFPALWAEKPREQRNNDHLPQSPDTGTPGGESIPGGTRNPDEVEGYWSEQVFALEKQWEGLYEKYFDNNFSSLSLTPDQIADKLTQLSQQTGKRPAVVWMTSTPDYLALYIITPGKQPMGIRVPEGNQDALFNAIKQFHQQLQSPQSSAYLKPAQDLYKLMILPIEYHLRSQNIDTLILCVGPMLRSFPFAALHDGENFLIENYGITRIPGFNLTNWDYETLEDAQILAMGASEFPNDQPLPGVAAELSTITPGLWEGVTLLNEAFTLGNLKEHRQRNPYSIIHLATHAQFNPGNPSHSYIQFSDTRLNLKEMEDLNWSQPPVDLLVLSACNTALGDIDAELGFVGLALQSGVNSAVGSLWRASDLGTLGMMSEFYWQLKETSLKAEALRRAQMAMIQGNVRWREGQLETPREDISLTSEAMRVEGLDLSHPYYWSGFSLVGNPF